MDRIDAALGEEVDYLIPSEFFEIMTHRVISKALQV